MMAVFCSAAQFTSTKIATTNQAGTFLPHSQNEIEKWRHFSLFLRLGPSQHYKNTHTFPVVFVVQTDNAD